MRLIAYLLLLLLPALALGQKKRNAAFDAGDDDPKLPRVLIIGDSISIGYTVATRDALKGKANVHRIAANAGHTGMGIAGLPKWLAPAKGDWDVIHFNWGLWDLCYRNPTSKTQGRRDKENGTQTHTIEQYTKNLETIVGELKKTGAALVFATTTPVPEGEAGRKVGDDLRFNEAAVVLMKKHSIPVNDLHAAMADKMEEHQVKPGDVHFKPEGSKILGEQVAKHIEKALTGWQTLFDGSNLDHWTMEEEGGWVLEEGSVTGLMKEVERKGKKRTAGRGYLWSKERYDDFVLDVTYKMSPAGNSGVFYRSDPTNRVQGGLECQLMDNEGFQKVTGKKEDRKLNGSFYDSKAPTADVQREIGEWNELRIICKGPSIRFRLNGHLVIDVDVDDWTEPGKNPDGTTNKFKRALKDFPRDGHIGLQNHGQQVWFRDVRVRNL